MTSNSLVFTVEPKYHHKFYLNLYSHSVHTVKDYRIGREEKSVAQGIDRLFFI